MVLPGLILFSHGSLLCGSERLVFGHVDRLRESGNYCAVEAGFLNYSRPTLEEAIERCVRSGARQVVIVPYFLVGGYFVTTELPPRLTEAVKLFPNVKIKVARALEDAPLMADAVEQSIATARDVAEWREEAIMKAKVVCDLREDCPLYKSPMCRAFAE